MSKKLYIFCPEFDVSTVLPTSTLLTSVTQLLDKSEYHTSLGDLSAADIIAVSRMFDEIELVDNKFDHSSSLWFETKSLLNYLSHTVTVNNFNRKSSINFTTVDTNASSAGNRLWVFGCSYSHGVGLTHENEKFGSIISDRLGLPVTFVTKPGSSLQWSLRHLINTNFGPGDIVVWQLTTPGRLTVYDGKDHEVMLSRSTSRELITVFNDRQMFFHHCSLLNYGTQYLRASKTNFVLTSILYQDKFFYDYINEYTSYPEYCYIPNGNLDVGTDGLHIGPLSHKLIANRIIDHLQYKDE